MNPLVVVRTFDTGGRMLLLWCPGCQSMHAVHVPGEDGSLPNHVIWEWNGALDETFTISPSLLCHMSTHLCEGEHGPVVCPNPDSCGATGHLILNDDTTSHRLGQPEPSERILGHGTPHTRDPAWGNCHSFIRNGHWEFLGDCAHSLAGQTVPMVPVPDWMVH